MSFDVEWFNLQWNLLLNWLIDLDWGLLAIAIFGGMIRVGTPYLFVSLGECITERAGRVNLGLEGTLFMGGMAGYGVSYLTTRVLAAHTGLSESWIDALAPWSGVLAAGLVGVFMGSMHAVICNLPRVNFVALGIAMMYFGMGLARFLGKPLVQPQGRVPKLADFDLGAWYCWLLGEDPATFMEENVRNSLRVNHLFLFGLVLTFVLAWVLTNTRWGMILRLAGESEEAAAAMGYSVKTIRIVATAVGGFLAGMAGSYLSLYAPGSWNDDISKGQGLMAVALVIFARWNPIRCLWAALIFGGAGSLSLALQGQGKATATAGYLLDAAPYVLTLMIMMITSSRSRALAGAPGVLTGAR